MAGLMRDLTDGRWMVVKAVLFVVMGLLAGGMVVMELPRVRTVLLLAVCIWAFARAYYFCFYVIEKYIDPGFRYAGLWSVVRHYWGRGNCGTTDERG